MGSYSTSIDRKWQKKWEETGLYKFDRSRADKKLYCLEMFSYPSGAKLHIGHWWNFGLADSWTRMKRLQGWNVFHPMGFDAFGLPAENYAIKTGIHPQDSTLANIETMEKQLRTMGATYDWDYEVKTCMPDYYRWTQWLFLQLHKQGLAYRKEAPVNWCPSCNTVLANEQVVDGCCERCDTPVTKRNLTQWFFRITDYAEELLQKLDDLDWPERTKIMQRNWIGKSVGATIDFALADGSDTITVFTTRADTLYGVTYVVIAPEHPLVAKITTAEQRQAVVDYQEYAKRQSEVERLSTTKEKTGVFTGSYVVHPLTGEKLQVWIADYVLASYGTGCVMAVPGHDTRDYEFSVKYGLPIPRVIKAREAGADETLPYTEYGILVNSGEFDGLTSEQALVQIVARLEQLGKGAPKVTYRLRDWLVSRQRYWGAPIPVIYCEEHGIVPVPEEQLPVLLPYDVEFAPDGESPLAKSAEFVHTVCPICGKPARRDTDTLDTFVDSSWYFLRYPDNRNDRQPFDTEWINKLLPVDKYVGGPEHACMHLLYARFITKALRDGGFLNFDEPFMSLTHQGIILAADGQRMSKSKGNTVSPDDYIEQYGSDVFRLYLAFGFDYTAGGPWSDDGLKAVARFVDRLERWIDRSRELAAGKGHSEMGAAERELNYVRNYTIKSVTADAEVYSFNTSVARMMELLNALNKYDQDSAVVNRELVTATTRDLILLVSPFAPHFAEEMWERLGYPYSIFDQSWPGFDPQALVRDMVELAVQVNGKVRGRVEVAADATDDDIRASALVVDSVKPHLEGKEIKKVVVVRGRLVSIVVA
ncbi:MAG: leucine--tRNA ligase [Chloroflexota bacterium]